MNEYDLMKAGDSLVDFGLFGDCYGSGLNESSDKQSKVRSQGTCRYCGMFGHWLRISGGMRLCDGDGKPHECNEFKVKRLVKQNKTLDPENESDVKSISSWWINVFRDVVENKFSQGKESILKELNSLEDSL